MLTFKFDYVDALDKNQGCVRVLEGNHLWYQRRNAESEVEYKDYIDSLPFFEVIGVPPLESVSKDDPIIHFKHMQFFDPSGKLQNVILCGGMCYVMNEEGKTVDVIN